MDSSTREEDRGGETAYPFARLIKWSLRFCRRTSRSYSFCARSDLVSFLHSQLSSIRCWARHIGGNVRQRLAIRMRGLQSDFGRPREIIPARMGVIGARHLRRAV